MTEQNLLPLTFDPIFKLFFKDEKNKELLISLLSNFLPLPEGSTIVSVDIMDPELLSEKSSTIQGERGKKYILDLRVEFERINASGREGNRNRQC